MTTPRQLRLLGALFGLFPVGAWAAPPSDAERAVIDRRLIPTAPHGPRQTIAEGDTLFVERAVEVPANRVPRSENDYEGLVTGIVNPAGLVLHDRLDIVRFVPLGAKTRVEMRYVIHVEPGTTRGGKIRGTLAIVERTGLANTVVSDKLDVTIDVTPSSPQPEDLAADFQGYRLYNSAARRGMTALEGRFQGLTLKDRARLPALERSDSRTAGAVYEFDRLRRRIWVAHRHLTAASNSRTPKISELAKLYLANLDRPDGELELPKVALVPEVKAAPPPTAPPVDRPADGTVRAEGRYDPTSDADPEDEPPPPPPPPPPVEAAPPPAPPPPAAAAEDDVVVDSDDPFGERRMGKTVYRPGYYRGLVLEDVNIAHGGGVRANYAKVTAQETAHTGTFFYFAQTGITRFLGIEATIPTEYVDLALAESRDRPLYALGNPMFAVKYRLHLPEIGGRAPALGIRVRYGLPLVPPHFVPPTNFGAEDFTREVNFADPYAFFMDRHDLGLGVNTAWRWQMLQLGLQLHWDYFLPVASARNQNSFSTLGYGLSVGVLPFGDWLGGFAEMRGTSLFAGPGRTELFTYLGVRGRFWELFEPAVWVTLPIGSVRDTHGFQVGGELRISYDLYEVIQTGKLKRSPGAWEF